MAVPVGKSTFDRLYNAFGGGTLTVAQLNALSDLFDFATGFMATEVTAAGNSQATATPLTTQRTIVTSAAASTGVQLLAGVNNVILNRGANPLLVYPGTGEQIEAFGINSPVTVDPNSRAEFSPSQITAGLWRVS